MSVVIEMSGDDAKLFKSFQRIIGQQTKMESKFKDIGASSKRAGKKVEEGFGSKAVGNLTRYAAGMLSIGAATGVATRAFRELVRVRQEAAQKLRAAEGGFGLLAQLAGSQEEFQQLVGRSQKFFAAGGAATQNEAATSIFNLQSAGIPASFDPLAAQSFGLFPGGTGDVFKNAGTALRSFPNAPGGFEGMLSRALVANVKSAVPASSILAGAGQAAQLGGEFGVGLSADEAIAAIALVGANTGSGEIAATQLGSFLNALTKKGVPAVGGGTRPIQPGQETLAGLVREVQTALPTLGEQTKFLGRTEATKFINSLQLDEFESLVGEQAEGVQGKALRQKIGFLEGDPTTQALRRERQLKNQSEVMQSELGVLALETAGDRAFIEGQLNALDSPAITTATSVIAPVGEFASNVTGQNVFAAAEDQAAVRLLSSAAKALMNVTQNLHSMFRGATGVPAGEDR